MIRIMYYLRHAAAQTYRGHAEGHWCLGPARAGLPAPEGLLPAAAKHWPGRDDLRHPTQGAQP